MIPQRMSLKSKHWGESHVRMDVWLIAYLGFPCSLAAIESACRITEPTCGVDSGFKPFYCYIDSIFLF